MSLLVLFHERHTGFEMFSFPELDKRSRNQHKTPGEWPTHILNEIIITTQAREDVPRRSGLPAHDWER
jgi:hypothetical protein